MCVAWLRMLIITELARVLLIAASFEAHVWQDFSGCQISKPSRIAITKTSKSCHTSIIHACCHCHFKTLRLYRPANTATLQANNCSSLSVFDNMMMVYIAASYFCHYIGFVLLIILGYYQTLVAIPTFTEARVSFRYSTVLYHTRVPYEILQATPVGIALRLCLNSVHIINFPSAFRLPHCFERRANQVFPRINTSTYLRLETTFQAVLVN